MSTSTPPAWNWLSECEVPIQVYQYATSETPSDQCANGEQNLPSALIPSDQCTECRSAPGQPHATGCDVSCGPVISCDRKHDNLDDGEPVVTVKCPVCRHEMETDEGVLCDLCEESIGVESFAVVNGPGGVFVYHLACYDEAYWGGPESVDKTADTLDPALDMVQSTQPDTTVKDKPPDCQAYEPDPVPFPVQSWLFEALIEREVDHLHEIIDDHHDEIVKMARRRHEKGFISYGSKGYQWDAKTRLRNVLEELSDAPTYLTMGPIE